MRKQSHRSAAKGVSRTGSIWKLSARARGQIVRRVCERLEAEHDRPRLGNPADPVDDLVFVMISNKTTPSSVEAVFDSLKSRYPTWDTVLERGIPVLRQLLQPAGLANIRARQIFDTLNKVHSDFGCCDITPLRSWPVEEAFAYLVALPGVSGKVARCVMMYTLGADVLPVDVHLHRIAGRLGWTSRKRADQSHEELEALVPPHRRYGLHVAAVIHGRTLCRRTDPKCAECSIVRYCEYSGRLQ